jgi:hypothetical protein
MFLFCPKTSGKLLVKIMVTNTNCDSCINVNAFYLGNGITGLITDIMVYLLSIPIVMPLQMDNKTKLQLLATMLIGGL